MKVYLVGQMCTRAAELNRFLNDEEIKDWYPHDSAGGERLVEMAGRLCYMSYGKGRKTNKEFIEHILEVGHGSVLEHAVYSFIITGVSRSLTHELVRHRHLSYSQLSQRYVDESESKFIMPDAIKGTGAEDVFGRLIDTAKTAYKILVANLEVKYRDIEDKTLRRKMARQAARSVLPNATETKIFVTGNARAWRHFIEMRGSVHADTEIRELAGMIHGILKEEAPAIFGDYCTIDVPGMGIWTDNRKV